MQVPTAHITTAANLGYFAESVLGPTTLVTYQPVSDSTLLDRWTRRVAQHGVKGHTDIVKAFDDWRRPAAAKGILEMPPPQTLMIWEHRYYRGNVYVYDTPTIIVISRHKGPVLLDYSWCDT